MSKGQWYEVKSEMRQQEKDRLWQTTQLAPGLAWKQRVRVVVVTMTMTMTMSEAASIHWTMITCPVWATQ